MPSSGQSPRRVQSTYTQILICRLMTSRTISLEASAYDRLRAAKRPGESFTEVVNRILEISRPSFRVLSGVLSSGDATRVKRAIEKMRAREARAEAERMVTMGGSRRGRHRRD